MAANNEKIEQSPVESTTIDIGIEAKVILFNDDYHDFIDVVNQIIKAINCTYDHAEALTWTAHTQGKVIVWSGALPRCIEISSILEEINLGTRVEY